MALLVQYQVVYILGRWGVFGFCNVTDFSFNGDGGARDGFLGRDGSAAPWSGCEVVHVPNL
jgi:hypothetical protein